MARQYGEVFADLMVAIWPCTIESTIDQTRQTLHKNRDTFVFDLVEDMG
jgi:hypothetical protein